METLPQQVINNSAAVQQETTRDILIYLAFKVGIWKQARVLVIMGEPKSTCPLILPAQKNTQGNIPLGLM